MQNLKLEERPPNRLAGLVTQADKLDRTLAKNIDKVYQAFALMDQSLYHVRAKAEDANDPALTERSGEIERQQQLIKHLMTSSFQQMKEFLKALTQADLPGSDSAARSDGKENHCQPSHLDDDFVFEVIEGNEQAIDKTAPNANSDSDDTIFYDAYDDMILTEIQKEFKRESNASNHQEDCDDEVRTTLPALKPEAKFSLLKILKDAIGKDLTKF